MNPNKAAPLIGSLSLILGVQAGAGLAQAPTTEHRVSKVVLESGNPAQTLSKGYTTMEAASVRCPNSQCTFGMRVMANLDSGACSDDWGIIGLTDGNSVDGGPLQGRLPADKSETRTWQGVSSVRQGTHTLAFQIYVPCPARANQWSVRYVVTNP